MGTKKGSCWFRKLNECAQRRASCRPRWCRLEEERKSATRSGGGEENRVRGAESEETEIKVAETWVAVLSKEVNTESTNEAKTETITEVGTEKSGELERVVKTRKVLTRLARAPALWSWRRDGG